MTKHKVFVHQTGLRSKWYAFCRCGWRSLGQDNRLQAESKGATHYRTARRNLQAAGNVPQAAPGTTNG